MEQKDIGKLTKLEQLYILAQQEGIEPLIFDDSKYDIEEILVWLDSHKEGLDFPLLPGLIFTNGPMISFLMEEEDIYPESEILSRIVIRPGSLSEEFISEYASVFTTQQWNSIVINQRLSEKIIEENSTSIDWYLLSKHQRLSEEFIEKYEDNLNWSAIVTYQNLSDEFFEKRKNKTSVMDLIGRNMRLQIQQEIDRDILATLDNMNQVRDGYYQNYSMGFSNNINQIRDGYY
jgi:hypothetical protein